MNTGISANVNMRPTTSNTLAGPMSAAAPTPMTMLMTVCSASALTGGLCRLSLVSPPGSAWDWAMAYHIRVVTFVDAMVTASAELSRASMRVGTPALDQNFLARTIYGASDELTKLLTLSTPQPVRI